jgi:hypothetical protein
MCWMKAVTPPLMLVLILNSSSKIRYKKRDPENNFWLYKIEDTLTETVQSD